MILVGGLVVLACGLCVASWLSARKTYSVEDLEPLENSRKGERGW